MPAWNGALTMKEAATIERVQRVAVKIIYGFKLSYNKILERNKLEKLTDRRERMCLNFASKALQHPRFRGWFKRIDAPGKAQYHEAVTRRKLLGKSSIPYMTRLLNQYNTQ